MKIILLLPLIWLSALLSEAMAQTRTVTGKITDATTSQGLPGVTAIVKNTQVGTTSDGEGNYTLNVPAGGTTLVFSFVGYTTVERLIGNATTINVAMSPDAKQLGEVVVTALGIEREKKSLSYSTQQVSGAQVTQAGNPNITNAIQGKVSGVTVRQSSGMPGASSQINIRGSRFFGETADNSPLYVVDGMPIASTSDFAEGVANDVVGRVSGTDFSSRALDINPNDIESVNVLKGAAAAALYGLRAANGVVIITTKSGRGLKGRQGATVTVNSDYTIDRASRLPNRQDVYAQGALGEDLLTPVFVQGNSRSWGPRIDQLGTYTSNITGQQVNGTGLVYDNVEPFFETGYTTNNGVNISQAGEVGNYSVGAGYTRQEGMIPTTGMERMNAKIAGDFNASPKVRLGISANYSDLHVDKIAGGSNLSNPLFTVYYAPRSFDLWGLPFERPDNPYAQYHYRGAMDNPRWSMKHNEFFEDTRRFFGNVNATYEAAAWLSFNYRLGIDYYITDGKEVYELGSGNTGGRTNPPSGGRITDFSITNNQVNSNVNATFNRDLTEAIHVNLVLGNELYDIRSRQLSNVGNGLNIGGFRNISNAASQRSEEKINRRRVVGFYSSLTASWRDMVYLNATGREDYVSNMPRGNRSFFYPSLGLGLVFTELLPAGQQVLSFGKLRASYAQVGATGPLYPSRDVFLVGGSSSGFLDDGILFPFNGLAGYTFSDIKRNPDLKPQNTKTYEYGLELRFLDNRIGLDYTYFTSDVTDQIFEVPMAPATGFTDEIRNAGELRTTGHEATLNLTPVQAGSFRWDITANFTQYENRVRSLAPGVQNIFLGGFDVPNVRAQAGQTFPVIFGSRYLRDAAGNIVHDGSGSSDPNAPDWNPFRGMPIQDTEAGVIGRVQPDFEFGFINTLAFKGLTLTAQLDWRQGGQMYSGNTMLGRLYGILEETEDREREVILPGVKTVTDAGGQVSYAPNDIPVKRNQIYYDFSLSSLDEAHVFNTSFVRLREATLAYDLPKALIERTRAFTAAAITFTGRNLFLITDYPNFDPETSVGGASNFQGLEYVSLPQSRSFGVGVRLTF